MPEFSVSLAPEIPPPVVTVVANFGMVAGRRVSQAEIEMLWLSVEGIVPQATITVEDRNQFAKRTSTCVHQVSVAVDDEMFRRAHQDPELLREQLGRALEQWVTVCAGRVRGELTFAERTARSAVIDSA
jgi:hypothetical protein